jgi:hyperosmotically inducible periplasmic protein
MAMRTQWTSGAILVAMLLAGCSPREQQQATDTTEKALKDAGNTATKALEKAGKVAVKAMDTTKDLASNASITGTVKSKLTATTGMPVSQIDVTTKDGVTILSGQVYSSAQKAQAESLTKNTPGVKKVVNKLTVGKNASGKNAASHNNNAAGKKPSNPTKGKTPAKG